MRCLLSVSNSDRRTRIRNFWEDQDTFIELEDVEGAREQLLVVAVLSIDRDVAGIEQLGTLSSPHSACYARSCAPTCS